MFAGCVMPGAGAFEIAAHAGLMKYKDTVKGRARLGNNIFIDNMLTTYSLTAC